jgi:hypothetical protein
MFFEGENMKILKLTRHIVIMVLCLIFIVMVSHPSGYTTGCFYIGPDGTATEYTKASYIAYGIHNDSNVYTFIHNTTADVANNVYTHAQEVEEGMKCISANTNLTVINTWTIIQVLTTMSIFALLAVLINETYGATVCLIEIFGDRKKRKQAVADTGSVLNTESRCADLTSDSETNSVHQTSDSVSDNVETANVFGALKKISNVTNIIQPTNKRTPAKPSKIAKSESEKRQELDKYEELLAMGAITKKEYEEKKAQIFES